MLRSMDATHLYRMIPDDTGCTGSVFLFPATSTWRCQRGERRDRRFQRWNRLVVPYVPEKTRRWHHPMNVCRRSRIQGLKCDEMCYQMDLLTLCLTLTVREKIRKAPEWSSSLKSPVIIFGVTRRDYVRLHSQLVAPPVFGFKAAESNHTICHLSLYITLPCQSLITIFF